jgi:putative restriction endonuclease
MINHAERAFRAWPILTECARNQETITYGELAGRLGIHHRADQYLLGEIQDYCLEAKLPPLTIMVVNIRGRPGGGFIAWDIDNFEDGFDYVCGFNWNQISNPFAFAENGATYEELKRRLVSDPDNSEDIYRLVKCRGIAQVLFRDALMLAYQRRCAFTQLSFSDALQAAHIVPWSACTPALRLDVRNGILLNALHHRLFDTGCMTLTVDYRIYYYDPKMKDGPYSATDKSLTVNLHRKLMHLPSDKKAWPRPKYIKQHHKIWEWEIEPSH